MYGRKLTIWAASGAAPIVRIETSDKITTGTRARHGHFMNIPPE
jgi:hypothetical protein